MRASVRWLGSAPSAGSRCTKSTTAGACCQISSLSLPSSTIGLVEGTATASAAATTARRSLPAANVGANNTSANEKAHRQDFISTGIDGFEVRKVGDTGHRRGGSSADQAKIARNRSGKRLVIICLPSTRRTDVPRVSAFRCFRERCYFSMFSPRSTHSSQPPLSALAPGIPFAARSTEARAAVISLAQAQ